MAVEEKSGQRTSTSVGVNKETVRETDGQTRDSDGNVVNEGDSKISSTSTTTERTSTDKS